LAHVWDDVIGQPDAVTQLQLAARAPVHAYLFVGQRGSGKRAAARAFAAMLLSDGLPDESSARAVALCLEEKHPDLVVVQPEGARISAPQARAIVRAAARSPVEGTRQVLVLCEMDRIEQVAPILLKSIEEPPDATVFVLLAEEVVPDLVTLASRCVRIDFRPLAEQVVLDRLLAEGVDPVRAADAAAAAGGDLDRARLLATDDHLARRRDAWRAIPDRLDNTGAVVMTLVDEVRALIDEAQRPLDDRHSAEFRELEEREERYGGRGSGRRELVDRQKREVRRHRTIELRFGFATLAGRYRDALVASAHPRPYVEAVDGIQAAADALQRNPTEALLLQALFARLPPIV
jgi:DNA polymerase-3 subunit delta'